MDNDSWFVYTQADCKWCDKTADLLAKYTDREPQWADISDPDHRAMFEGNGFTTVPKIYRNGNYIGGYEDLLAYFNMMIAASTTPPQVPEGAYVTT